MGCDGCEKGGLVYRIDGEECLIYAGKTDVFVKGGGLGSAECSERKAQRDDESE